MQDCQRIATTQGWRLAQPCSSNCTVQHSGMQHAALLSCHGPPTRRQGHAGAADIKADDEGRIGFENYLAELTRKRDELVKRTEANQKWIVSPGCIWLKRIGHAAKLTPSSHTLCLLDDGCMWKQTLPCR